MRQDMKDLLLDTGRHSGTYGDYATSRRARLKRTNEDDLPLFISSSRHRGGGKELGDRLAPLRKFLKKNCGRPWADVYAEICAFADTRSVRGYHLRQHVWNYVVPSDYLVGHRRRYGPFFVDPNGILQEEYQPSRKEQRARWKNSPYFKDKQENPILKIDADHWYEKIKGYWYHFETQHFTYQCSYEDLVEENGEVKIVRYQISIVRKLSKSKSMAGLKKNWILNMGRPSAIDQVSTDWAKHLRVRGKRTFHRKVRQKVRKELARKVNLRAED